MDFSHERRKTTEAHSCNFYTFNVMRDNEIHSQHSYKKKKTNPTQILKMNCVEMNDSIHNAVKENLESQKTE